MANSYPLQVITPERNVLSEDVVMTVAPGADGYLGVLAHHAPLMTTLRPGELRVTLADGRTTSHIVIGGGFLEVSHEGAVVLADSAERSDEIDVTRAEVDLAEARRMIESLPPGTPEARRALTQAQHAEVRIRVGSSER
jgi:F-type H+-transporting ATPase subunit epsilon